MNSRLSDEGVTHKPGECQTDGRDRQVMLKGSYRKLHVFHFAALLQEVTNLRLSLTKICEPCIERLRIRQVRHLFRVDKLEMPLKAFQVGRKVRTRSVW